MFYNYASEQEQYSDDLEQGYMDDQDYTGNQDEDYADDQDEDYSDDRDDDDAGDQEYGNRMDMGADMNMDMSYGITGRDIMLEKEIIKAIIGEAQAYYFYESLAQAAPKEEYKKVIKGIQEDEAKHYHWYTMILRRMGGEMPQIPMGKEPKNFEEGVKTAINDELEANEFYMDVAYRATDPYIEMHFMHAAHDEQRHATLLQNILIDMLMEE